MISCKLKNERNVTLDKVPNVCPYCHKSIIPEKLTDQDSASFLEIIFCCPNFNCKKSFIAYYYSEGSEYYFYYHSCNIGELIKAEFSEEIQVISNSFVEIFNQALFAEQHKLTSICGVGYRKAFEFLIKDYLILKNSEQKEKIEKKFLGKCIDEDISDSKIKNVAKRATWLGNDEAHYVKTWEDHDIDDLKKLIKLTVYWIESEILTASLEKSMPSKT